MNPIQPEAAAALELFMELRRGGEHVDPAAFAARYPDHEDDLTVALDALMALEQSTREKTCDEALPVRIGPYRVVREIGRGGMGVVLEAVEEPLGRRVALKILPPEHLVSATARERFRREATLASQLEHAGIATIFGAGVDAEEPWIAMRFVEGESLAHKIASGRELGLECIRLDAAHASGRESALLVAACLAGVARALQYAHERGIVHRDVKPSNVLVTREGAAVLLDFGLAIGTESDAPTLTRTGQTAGTPAYLPPELISGERARPDARSDVYALGVTLYECLTLRRPFEGPTQVALYRAIVSGTASGVRTQNHDVPRDLAVIVATAMERDPLRRYHSAAAFADDLEACVAGRPILARPLPLSGRVLRWARREPRQALLTSLLAVAAVGLASFGGSWLSSRERVLAADRMDRDHRFEIDLQNGYADLAMRRRGTADQHFTHALTLRPDSIEALVGRALVLIDDKRDDEAMEILGRAPNSPALEALRSVARGGSPALDLGPEWLANAASIELFVDGLRIAKQAERAQRNERKPLFQLASDRFGEAVNRSSGARAFYHVKRAFAARDAGHEAGVRSAAAALSTLWPDSARAVFTAGNALNKYDKQAARRLLQRSIALDPNWGPAHQNLGNAYYFAMEYELAIRELHEAVRLDRRDADAFNTLAISNDAVGCRDDARAAFESALALRPSMFEAWANLGRLEFTCENDAAAAYALERALDLAPHEPIPRSLLAWTYHRQGEFERSLREYEALIAMNAHDIEAWKGLATNLVELSNWRDGLLAAEIVLEMSPGDPVGSRMQELAFEGLTQAGLIR